MLLSLAHLVTGLLLLQQGVVAAPAERTEVLDIESREIDVNSTSACPGNAQMTRRGSGADDLLTQKYETCKQTLRTLSNADSLIVDIVSTMKVPTLHYQSDVDEVQQHYGKLLRSSKNLILLKKFATGINYKNPKASFKKSVRLQSCEASWNEVERAMTADYTQYLLGHIDDEYFRREFQESVRRIYNVYLSAKKVHDGCGSTENLIH